MTDEGGLKMLLGLLGLLLVLGEGFLVYFLVAIGRDNLVTRAGLEFQQFEMPGLDEPTAYASASSGKVEDGLASESTCISWRKRDLAPGGQRIRSERQRGQDKF